jgi:GTP-binding protein
MPDSPTPAQPFTGMQIKSVEFAGAIGQVGQAPPASLGSLPQLAVSGRSNVGKSSLINHFLGRTRTPIARVSSTPGKTQEINFFRVRTDAGEFALVDLPGYGFAKAPAALRERWGQVIGSFLRSSRELLGIVQLIDIRHGPTAEDRGSIEFLAELGLPVLFVLTKADKLKPQRRREAIREIGEALGLDESQVIACSVLSGQGMDELRSSVGSLLIGAAAEGEAASTDPEGEAASTDPEGEAAGGNAQGEALGEDAEGGDGEGERG